MICPQSYASGSFLQTCINFVQQRLTFSRFEGSIISYGTRPVTSQVFALVTYVKDPNLDLIINIWKIKKGREKRKRFKLNGEFELSHKFRAFIRCMKAAFHIPDYQKFLMCPLIKRLDRAFETLSRALEGLREN